jgi:hypothetical protein
MRADGTSDGPIAPRDWKKIGATYPAARSCEYVEYPRIDRSN